MRPTRRLLALPIVLLLLVPAVAQAQVATPVASPTPELPLDLAAMSLTPADLETIGWANAAVGASSLRDLAAEIDLLAYDPKLAPLQASYRERLTAAGLRHRYANTLFQIAVPLQTTGNGSYQSDRIVTTGVVDYATAAGAAAGFALTEDESYDPSLHDVVSIRRFGDQSEVTRGVDPSTAVPWLNLTFQLGNLVADVWLTDYTVAEPDLASVETLAELLHDRIERILAGGAPNLSTRILRLHPITGQIWWNYSVDRFSRIDGQLASSYWSLIDALTTAATPQAQTLEGGTDPFTGARYDFAAYITNDPWLLPPTSGQVTALSSFNSSLTDDGTAETAAEHLALLRRDYSAIPDPTRFSLVPGAPTFGDESFTAKLIFNGRLNYYIVARLGSIIASVYVFAPDRPTAVAAVESLMTAQLACIQSLNRCEPLPMPDALMS